ncbi:MAG: hypothetical protein BGO78_02510 [Chloroflexi bacterium 44-23]|nr:MAG: hypothetical protein BGO78_02510 [Chloroflexi bacterium 44-23]
MLINKQLNDYSMIISPQTRGLTSSPSPSVQTAGELQEDWERKLGEPVPIASLFQGLKGSTGNGINLKTMCIHIFPPRFRGENE